MNDTLVTIIAIFLAAVLMFIFPLMTLADRNDEVIQLTVQTQTEEFVAEIRRTGKLTEDQYNNFIASLATTGNTYEVEMEFQILDENPGKKTAQGNVTVIGENVYYSVFTTQIVEKLGDSKTKNTYYLKEGDIVSVTVKNTSTTLAQTLRGFYYKVTGNDIYVIFASAAGIVL